jgi:hypothetical protein
MDVSPLKIRCGADMRPADTRKHCELEETSRILMKIATNQLRP